MGSGTGGEAVEVVLAGGGKGFEELLVTGGVVVWKEAVVGVVEGDATG